MRLKMCNKYKTSLCRIQVYSSSEVTLENSPFSNFVFQKIGFISVKPCGTHPSSFTWYKLMEPPENASLCIAAIILLRPSSRASSTLRSYRYSASNTPYANVWPEPTQNRFPDNLVPSLSM